ncbi:zinc finger CCCH domain-containing protein 3 [Andrographis paniculata]|uniref:zinc finger CCCH domain-containing protein 3 n=1 Tax=Andrographis paniculata TaxID=175694 RepID=UPI0021E7DD26|nr:zinc finger CCCH domain-containing protein 3 [Andrographis paniculata]
MPGNRKLQRNGSATERVEDAMRRLKVGDDDKGRGGDETGSYPDRPGEPDCIYYLRTGSCGYGSNCRFNHPSDPRQVYDAKSTTELPERAGQQECGHYLRTGTCKYGPTCKYHHPKNRKVDVLMNILGLPMRQDARLCQYYMRTGLCKYGSDCKYHHPQPPSAGANMLPVVGPAYGSGGSANVPSSGMTSLDELSAASMPKQTYFAGSFFQLPQSYIPYFVPPSHGWNTYMGSVNPLSVPGVLTAPPSNGRQQSVTNLPERPGQPECRYFMNHGSCKYGSDCRYNHPREKMSQLPPNSLGPLGLPIRPGQPVCSNYALYGLCKYGPTCNFDHPMDGYSYGYSLTAPPLASVYASSIPYGMAPVVPSPNINAPPTKSSWLSDWIKKGAATASNKNQNVNAKEVAAGDSPDKPDSIPHSHSHSLSPEASSADVIDNSD